MEKKEDREKQLLKRIIIIRLTEDQFQKLDKLKAESRLRCIGEVCRNILENRKLKLYVQDVTMNPTMEQLALIRKELKLIGININQIARKFNAEGTRGQQPVYLQQVVTNYLKIEPRVEELLSIVNKLAEKWLQG